MKVILLSLFLVASTSGAPGRTNDQQSKRQLEDWLNGYNQESQKFLECSEQPSKDWCYQCCHEAHFAVESELSQCDQMCWWLPKPQHQPTTQGAPTNAPTTADS